MYPDNTPVFKDNKIYGARKLTEEWRDGFTVDKMKEAIRKRFEKAENKTATALKEDYGMSMSGGATPLWKPGLGLSWSCNAKGVTIDMHGFQYVPNKEYTLTWKEVSDILTSTQDSLPIADEHPRVAEIKQEVIDNELPFKQEAELPPLKSYRKYEVVSRPTERKDRIFGNLIEEHGENLASLYQQFSGKGGLHEVEFRNCDNFHEYTALKQEFEMGQFFTPDDVAEKMVQLLRLPDSVKVMDATCGMGRFFNFIPNETRIYGLDNSWENIDVCKRLYPEAAKTLNFRHNDLSERAM